MPTITFTVDGPSSNTGGTLTFRPRTSFADPETGDILTPEKSRRPVEYVCNTPANVELPDGPWEVGGLEHNRLFPIDVSADALLKDLIVFGLPTTAPVTTLSQAVTVWLAANVNTEVSDALIAGAVSTPGSEAKTALDAAYAPKSLEDGLPAAISAALAEDETVATAAAAAVGDAISDADLLQALESAGSADDAAVVFTDADGRRGWLEWNATGGLTNLAKLLICAAIGFWRGPTEPAFPCVWFKTDPVTGELLDILDVTA
ncbi:minor tail protein [Gordonia phage Cashline]|nr:minor tail protein [Gordonia phage Cashline]